jgi:hypothetical protein
MNQKRPEGRNKIDQSGDPGGTRRLAKLHYPAIHHRVDRLAELDHERCVTG